MNDKLKNLKEVIKLYYKLLCSGIYNTRSLAGDETVNLYNDNGVRIDGCFSYGYFEVFGLSDIEFKELSQYYVGLLQEDAESIRDMAMKELMEE